MQLSIEAIIILVIAFTLLGFGILFVKNVFNKANDNTDSYLTTKACTLATSEYPIAPDAYTVDKGSAEQVRLCVFNNAASDLQQVRPFIEGCTAPGTGTWSATPPLNITVAPLSIERNKGAEFKATINAADNADIGSYICNIYAQKSDKTGEKIGPLQVTVEVK
jgi:hypothetical protein